MKKILLSIAVAVILASCSKSGGLQVNPDFKSVDDWLNQPAVSVTTTAPDYYGETVTQTEKSKAISMPSKTNVTLSYAVTSGQVKDVKWFINDAQVGTGNNVVVTESGIGDKTLKLVYKDAANDKEYSKSLRLRVFRYVYTNISFNMPDSVCGDINIYGGIKTVPATADCKSLSGTAENVVLFVSDYNSQYLIAYSKRNNIFPVMLNTVSGKQTNNFTPGTYQITGGSITVIK